MFNAIFRGMFQIFILIFQIESIITEASNLIQKMKMPANHCGFTYIKLHVNEQLHHKNEVLSAQRPQIYP